MKHLKKFISRALAFTLCVAMLFGTVNASATPLKEDANWQTKHSTWTPKEADIDIPNTAGDLTNEQLQTAVLSSKDTPEVVTDEVITENNHVNRLWEQEPNDNTIIFQNKDGSKAAYFYSRPVKYTDANGEKHDKRNTLVNTVGNAKYVEDYGYVNAYNDIKTYYPKSIQPENGMVLETPDLTLELSPLSATEKRYVLSDGRELTPAEYEAQSAVMSSEKQKSASLTDTAQVRETVLQAGTVAAQKGQLQEVGIRAKDMVQYKEVFGSKTSVRYSSSFEGFKEDIILDENIGVNEFKFRLKTNGLSLVDTGDGNFCLINPLTGKSMAAVGDLIVTDSKLQHESNVQTKEIALGETSEQHETETVFSEVQYEHHYKAETVMPEQEYILTVIVDESYLNDPETVYPVYVDPTMTVMGSGDIEDVSLYSNINYTLGSTESQQIKVGYSSPTYGTGRALYDFPILNFNTDFIFLYGNQITSSRLYMYCLPYGSSMDDSKNLSLWKFYSQWSPSTAKWNNTSPYNYGCLIQTKGVTSGWTNFDISSITEMFKTDPDATMGFLDHGLMLKAESETSATWKKFASSEYTTTSYRPYIQITYNDSPSRCDEVQSGAVYHLRNYSGDYLDVYNANTGDNTPLIQYSFTGNSNQRFKITNVTGGEYEIEPQHTNGKVLSVNVSNQVIIEPDCNISRQRWYIFYRKGSYHFVNKQNNTKVMEVQYGTDYVTTTNSYDYCDWELVPTIDYPDTMTDQNTQDAIRAYKELYYQATYSYQRGEITLSEKNNTQEALETQMNVVRADYIITENNPQSDYAYAALGGTRTGTPQWPFTHDLVYNSSNPMTGLDVVVIQRVMTLYGYFDGEYGIFDADTNQAVFDWKRFSENQGTVDRYVFSSIFSSSNFAERTINLVSGILLYSARHAAVQLMCIPILTAIPEVTINVPGGFKGRADLVHDNGSGSGSYIWEIKPNNTKYYGPDGIGTKQLANYILQGNNSSSTISNQLLGLTFPKPVSAGYRIATFSFETPWGEILQVDPSPYLPTPQSGLILYKVVTREDAVNFVTEPSEVTIESYDFGFVPCSTINWGAIGITTVVCVVVIGGVICIAAAPATGGGSLAGFVPIGKLAGAY